MTARRFPPPWSMRKQLPIGRRLGYILEASVRRIGGGTINVREMSDASGAEETDAIRVE
jgi:hypothetical protein